MSLDNSLKRRLYEMGAGGLATLAVMSIVSPTSGDIGILRLIVSIVLYGGLGLLLLRKAAPLYQTEIDPFEVLMMMLTGSAALLFLLVFTTSLLTSNIGVAVFGFVLFGVPAAVLWIVNSNRRTETLAVA